MAAFARFDVLAYLGERTGTPAKVAKPAKAPPNFSNFSRFSSPPPASAGALDPDGIERASIIQHDGGYPAEVADRHARSGWDADDWHRELGQWIARRRRFGYPEIEARSWAFGASINEWHARHGRVPGPGHCAGCGKPLDGAAALSWPDGARVHDLGCAARWGEHWRTRAAEGLAALGIAVPEGWSA